MKAIAVQGCTLTLEYTATGGENGVATTTTTPSTKVKLEGKGVHRGPMTITVSGITNSKAGATTPSTPIVVTLNPTAEKTSVEGQYPIREGDTVTGIAHPFTTAVPPVDVPTKFTVKVSDAGQSSGRCN